MGGGGSTYFTDDDPEPMPLYLCLGSLIEGAPDARGNRSSSSNQSRSTQLQLDNTAYNATTTDDYDNDVLIYNIGDLDCSDSEASDTGDEQWAQEKRRRSL